MGRHRDRLGKFAIAIAARDNIKSLTYSLYSSLQMCIILWSTRVYIIVWMIFGIVSLAFGAINVSRLVVGGDVIEAHENISNPL